MFEKRWNNIFYSDDDGAGGGDESKKFAQEEVDRIITDRLERERSKHQKELEARDSKIKELGFESYEDVARLKGERDEYQKKVSEYEEKLTRTERVNKAKELGVDEKFIDYVLFKVQEDDKLEEFVKDNPNILSESFNKRSSNFDYKGGIAKKLEDAGSDEEYLKIRRENK